MNNEQLKKVKLKIHGMHCAACEVLIERKFKKIRGVEKVRVNHVDGVAEVYCSCEPRLDELNNVIRHDGYQVSRWSDHHAPAAELPHRNTKRDYIEIGAVFLILMAAYQILKSLDFLPKSLGIVDNMSLGVVFLIGLVAAMSTCIAVTGGLLLAVAAKYNERHPDLTGTQKFRPTIYFNIGRVVGYTVLGGLVGALGSVFTLSARASGMMTIIASLIMLILGFQLLHLFPWLKRFSPKMPKFLAHKIHDLSEKDSKAAPFSLGAATFFLPCGFTQALQLYVLAKGDPLTGALTMFVFSLGTLPALLSLSALSSFAKGGFKRYFLKFAGALVVMLGLFNINNGLALTGSNINLFSVFQSSDSQGIAQAAVDANVQIVDGTQVVDMKVVGLNYVPHRFTVVQGIPVEWRIDGSKAQGCAQVISVPKLGITEYLPPQGVKTITFTPQEQGEIKFSCTMGMTTRGAAFSVVPNPDAGGQQGDTPEAVNGALPTSNGSTDCNPVIMNCIEAQKVSMEVTRERGVYPNSFILKKGVPVELAIDSKVPLGGCMSVWVIPEYNVTIPMKIGMNTTRFTPTKAGTVALTCSMGSRMAQLVVTN